MLRVNGQCPTFVGIDFGTTNSSAARFDARAGSAKPVANSYGAYRTRSLVYFGDRGVLLGRAVEELLESRADDHGRLSALRERVVADVKRRLLRPPVIHIPGFRDVRPVEVVAEILLRLRRDAEAGHGEARVRRAVLAHPVSFDIVHQKKLVEAAVLAGFREVELIEEPVAAALALERAGMLGERGTLIFDLGGGTLDLAFVVPEEGGGFRVAVDTDGDERCGGDDFDQALYDHLDAEAERSLGARLGRGGGVNYSALLCCRRLKERLSESERATFAAAPGGPRSYSGDVERATFERLIAEIVEKAVRRAAALAKRAQDEGHRVDAVALVGGAAKTPLVGQRLRKELSAEVRTCEISDLAVTLGAAYHAQALWGDPKAHKQRRKTGDLAKTTVESMQGVNTGSLELRALQERERSARDSSEWAACARLWAENRKSPQAAVRCMRQAERSAKSLGDWLACAEVWQQSLDAEMEATKCLGRALGFASESREWARCAEYFLKVFPESPAAEQLMRKAESVARDPAERALCAEYRHRHFGGPKGAMQFGRHEGRDGATKPRAVVSTKPRAVVSRRTHAGAEAGAGARANDPRELFVLEVLRRCAASQRNQPGFRLYVRPDVEPAKLAAARASMNVPTSEQVLGLIDISALGSGRSGVLFGRSGVYFRFAGMEAGASITYERMRGVKFSARPEGSHASLLANNAPLPGTGLRPEVAALLCEILNGVNPPAA